MRLFNAHTENRFQAAAGFFWIPLLFAVCPLALHASNQDLPPINDELEQIIQATGYVSPRQQEDRLTALLEQAGFRSEEQRAVLLVLADHYEAQGLITQSVAVLEELVDLFRDDSGRPDWFFRLGRLHRDLGAVDTAIARFYQVLDPSTIRDKTTGGYRTLSQRAQFEIARTYFRQGRYTLARELFDRVQRLDLEKADKETVLYYQIRCVFMEGVLDRIPAMADHFVARFPESLRTSEIRFMQAQSLEQRGHTEEALETVMDLLREAQPKGAANPERWIQWQRKAGNFFANHYYTAGDAATALSIYQTIAELSDDPEWLWPVVYQIGICAEQLGATDRAREAYQWLNRQVEKVEEATGAENTLSPQLQLVLEGALWRLEHLNRLSQIELQTRSLQEAAAFPL